MTVTKRGDASTDEDEGAKDPSSDVSDELSLGRSPRGGALLRIKIENSNGTPPPPDDGHREHEEKNNNGCGDDSKVSGGGGGGGQRSSSSPRRIGSPHRKLLEAIAKQSRVTAAEIPGSISSSSFIASSTSPLERRRANIQTLREKVASTVSQQSHYFSSGSSDSFNNAGEGKSESRASSRQAHEDLHEFLYDLQLLHYMDDFLEMGVRRVRDLRFVTQEDLDGLMKRIEKRKFLKASAELKTPHGHHEQTLGGRVCLTLSTQDISVQAESARTEPGKCGNAH